MTDHNIIRFLHSEMDKTFRNDDSYRCHAAILYKWHGENFTDRMFDSTNLIDAVESLQGKKDCYFSINSFYCKKRSTSTIRHLNGFVVDYDYYKISEYSDLSPEEMYRIHIKHTLPIEPSFVVDSGRGLYCVFAIDHAPYSCISLYKAIYTRLVESQKQFGADSKAALTTQVIRVPGSVNGRSERRVRVLEASEKRYSITELAELYLPFSRAEVRDYKSMKRRQTQTAFTPQKRKAYKQSHLQSQLSVFEFDLKTLINMRNSAGVDSGYREHLLYLYWESLLWRNIPEDRIHRLVIRMNDRFMMPLDSKTVLKQCRPARKYRFRSSYQTIIKKLQITEEEMKSLKVLVASNIKKRRYEKKRRRNSVGKTKKVEAIRHRREVVISKIGILKVSQIADLFDVSTKTIFRDLEYITNHLAEFQEILQKLWKESLQIFDVNDFIQKVIDLSADLSWKGFPEFYRVKGRWNFI